MIETLERTLSTRSDLRTMYVAFSHERGFECAIRENNGLRGDVLAYTYNTSLEAALNDLANMCNSLKEVVT